MKSFPMAALRNHLARRSMVTRPLSRTPKLAVQNLEDRVTPSAPPAPTGFTATTTTFTNNTQVTISDSTTVQSQITVSGAGTFLHDVDMTSFIKHTFGGDLDITLTSPQGTSVTITTDNGGGNDDVYNGTLWDDEADPGNEAPFSAATLASSNMVTDTVYANVTVETLLTPEEALGAFIGENPNGVWTIKISDDAGGDVGTLDQWKLDITTLDLGVSSTSLQTFTESPAAAVGPAVTTTTRTINVSGAPTYLKNLTLFTDIAHTGNADLDITLKSPSGTIVTLTSDNGGTLDNVFAGTTWDDDADPGNPAPYSPSASSRMVGDTVYTNLVVKPRLVPEEPLSAFIGEDPNGTWTLVIGDDLANTDGGTLNSWTLNVRGAAPYGTPTASPVSVPSINYLNNGASTYTFTVKFEDNVAIDVDSIINNNDAVKVTGPGGFDQFATYQSIDVASDGTPRSATYTVTPPGGAWDAADNGAYTVSIVANEILDTSGNPVIGDALATFNTGIFLVTSPASSGTGTLAEMITSANALSGTDLVGFDPGVFGTAQTISLTAALPTISDSINIIGPGSGLLTVQRDAGAGSIRIFDSTAANVTMSGMTVTGGSVTGDGGGMLAMGTPNLAFDDMVFAGNTATAEGGAIYLNTGGTITIRNSRLTGNTAGTDGGAIYFFSGGGLLMENTTVADNKANGTTGGGGIYFYATASQFIVRNSTFSGNTTNGSGGGIHLLGTFTGVADIQNSTFTGNTATSGGGGIALTSGPGGVLLTNSTFKGNTAASGGGIARSSTTAATATSFVTLANSVVAQNTGGASPDILASTTTTTNANFSLIFNAGGHTLSGSSTDNQAYGADPLLGPLADNGGPTLTMAPQPGSPLIDTGSTALIPAGLSTDQRLTVPGIVRNYGSAVDIGSFEVQPATVTINQAVGQAGITNASPILFDVKFNMPVTGFDGTDIDFTGSGLGGLSANVIGSGSTYTVEITGMNGVGTVVASLLNGAAIDGSGTASLASTSTDNSVTFDNVGPDVNVTRGATQPLFTNASPAVFDVHFTEPVLGFTDSDVDLSLGTLTGLSATVTDTGNGQDFTISVTGMTGVGTIIPLVLPSSVTDLAGNVLLNTTGTGNLVNFDDVAPNVAIDQSTLTLDPTSTGPILFEVHFQEVMTGFDASDIDFSASTVGGTFSASLLTTDNMNWVVSVTGMSGEGFLIATIPAGAAFDPAGNGNNASSSVDNSVYFDNQAPTPAINQGSSQADPTNGSPIVFGVVFDEPVTGFDESDVLFTGSTVGGTLVASVAGSGTTYTVSVTGMTGEGDVIASIPLGAAFDTLLNTSAASTSTDNVVHFDAVAPTVTINKTSGQADPTNTGPIVFDVVFAEPVSGFTASDISFAGSTVGGALLASVSGSGAVYTVTVTGMTGNGDIVASVLANSALDLAGNNNVASTSTDNVVEFDTTSPTVTINQASGQVDPINAGPIVFDVVFSEPVTGFSASDVALSGTVGGTLLASVAGSGTTYTVSVTGMTGVGTVIASVNALAANDAAGNASVASTSTDNTVTFDEINPLVTIEQAVGQVDPVTAGPILFDVVFSKPVTGFDGTDIDFTGSTVGGTLVAAVTGSGTTYTVSVTGMFGSGTVVASVLAGAAQDAATNGNLASTSVDNSVSYNGIGTVSLDAAVYAGNEGNTPAGTTLTVSVTRTGGTDGALSFNYDFTNVTASGTDYSVDLGTSGTISWGDGESDIKTFVVTINNDAISEGLETVNIALSNLLSALGTPFAGTTAAVLSIAKSDPLKVDATTKFVASFPDADGDIVSVRMGGKTGSADVYLTNDKGPISSIDLIGTSSAKSTVSVTVKKNKTTGDGFVTINEVAGTGVKSFAAKAADLVGPAGFNLGTNYIGTLTLRNISGGADIVAGGTNTQKTRITVGTVADGSDIVLGSILSSLTATSFADTDATADIVAPSAGNIVIKGNFSGDIDLSGAGVDHTKKKKTLNKLDVKGIVDGSDINVVGNIGVVSVYNFLNSRLFGGYVGADDGSTAGGFNAIPTTITSFKTAKNAKLLLNGDFANSSVIASVINTATIGNVIVGNASDKFGLFAGDTLKLATVTIGGIKQVVKNGIGFPQIGDFAIEIV